VRAPRGWAHRQGAFFLQNPDGVSGNPQALLGPEIQFHQ
jgi:hypothetical protein